jgi:hypothetical protein
MLQGLGHELLTFTLKVQILNHSTTTFFCNKATHHKIINKRLMQPKYQNLHEVGDGISYIIVVATTNNHSIIKCTCKYNCM